MTLKYATYELTGRIDYEAFASTVANILSSAVALHPTLRLQAVKHRAKDPASLAKKLADRKLLRSRRIEDEIKDLAGCRLIFYTNADVAAFMATRIVRDNFDVVEVKAHQAERQVQGEGRLYTSTHFTVCLASSRASLPEYARFAGMKCEIQIQTVLDHAWAELDHDTFYKSPDLEGVAAGHLDALKLQLSNIMRRRLIPAGHELDAVVAKMSRIQRGKVLFDGGALQSLSDASDNNRRFDQLEEFVEYVLPYFYEMPGSYAAVVQALEASLDVARQTGPQAIVTEFGTIPAKTSADFVSRVADILASYGYCDIDLTLSTAIRIYRASTDNSEREHATRIAVSLAQHNKAAWEQVGPEVQVRILAFLECLSASDRVELGNLIVPVVAQLLKPDIEGTTWRSDSVVMHHGAIPGSDAVRGMRIRGLKILKELTKASTDEGAKTRALSAMSEATRTPHQAAYSDEFGIMVANDTSGIVQFQTDHARDFALETLQGLEELVHRYFKRYTAPNQAMRDKPAYLDAANGVVASALHFRDLVNADPEFVKFKVLIGYNSVFPQSWEEEEFGFEQMAAYRSAEVEKLVRDVGPATQDTWRRRVAHFASATTRDGASFIYFRMFVREIATRYPVIALDFVDEIEALRIRFMSTLVDGLIASGDFAARSRVDQWVDRRDHLLPISEYMQWSKPLDGALLDKVRSAAISAGDTDTLVSLIAVAERQYRNGNHQVIESTLFPVVDALVGKSVNWVEQSGAAWLGSPMVGALSEQQAQKLLDALLAVPEIRHGSEYILAAIAERWPASVIELLSRRQEKARRGKGQMHDALPFEVTFLKVPLRKVPDLLLSAARTWFDKEPTLFRFSGGNFLGRVFAQPDAVFVESLKSYAGSGKKSDVEFVFAVLTAFEGDPAVFGIVREAVSGLKKNSPLLDIAMDVLESTGVVSGEFGWVDAMKERRALVVPWLESDNRTVQTFAREFIRVADLRIAGEERWAQASIAARRLQYGEDVGDVLRE